MMQRLYTILIVATSIILHPPLITGFTTHAASQPRAVNPTSQFTGNKAVSIPLPVVRPVHHALSILGLSPSELDRSIYYDEGYQLMCRMPAIETVAQSPFHMIRWTQHTSEFLQSNPDLPISDILKYIISRMNPEFSYHRLQQAVDHDGVSLASAYAAMCSEYKVTPDPGIINKIETSNLPPQLDKDLGGFLILLVKADRVFNAAISRLNASQIQLLAGHPELYFFTKSGKFDYLTAYTDRQAERVDIARKIDMHGIFHSACTMAEAVDQLKTALKKIQSSETLRSFVKKPFAMTIMSPMGKIGLSIGRNDVYTENYDILIDIGGNDIYWFSPETQPEHRRHLSIIIDSQGDDTYRFDKSKAGMAAGCLSNRFVVDLSGDDTYRSSDMGQGCGIFGVGILADDQGNDRYEMGSMGQGFGAFGVGMLLDRKGNDVYRIRTMGQGCGSTMGFGLLCDYAGNDDYIADKDADTGSFFPGGFNMTQGVGISLRHPNWIRHISYYGGIGFLSDGDGDDRYTSSHGICMGSSYFMSLGALVDHRGNDTYQTNGKFGIGFGVHLSSGILIDYCGNDQYYGKNRVGGAGSDRSIGVLLDYQGDDRYGYPINESFEKFSTTKTIQEKTTESLSSLSEASFGFALKYKGLGFLFDLKGNDRYAGRSNGWGQSCGAVMPPVEPENWSHALLLDINGNDHYNLAPRKNNHYYTPMGYGLCYDTDHKNDGEFAVLLNDYNIQNKATGKKNIPDALTDNPQVLRLTDPCLFARFNAIGKIVGEQTSIVHELCRVLGVSEDRNLNRDLIEALTPFIVQGRMKKPETRAFVRLLNAADPYVQRYCAATLGWWKVVSTKKDLVNALDEPDPLTRSYVIQALGKMQDQHLLSNLVDRAENDSSPECRKTAFQAISGFPLDPLGSDYPVPMKNTVSRARILLHKGLLDDDPLIRKYACEGLRIFENGNVPIDKISTLFMDSNVYVRRAAAKTAILAGEKKGIPVLIETLKFRSIDTYEHYDHEIAKDLSFFCGIDFPGNIRYEYATWMNWWIRNGETVDLKINLDIMQRIQEAFSNWDTEERGLTIFRQLFSTYPDNVVIINRYRIFCREWIDYRLLAGGNLTVEKINRCLRLLAFLAQIDPDNARPHIRMADLYLRIQKFDQAITEMQRAIALDPENNDFKKRMKQIKIFIENRAVK